MKKLDPVVITPRIDTFTFDLPFPVCKAGTANDGLSGFLAGCVVPNYTTEERGCDLMQVDLTYDRVADVELVEGIPSRCTPAIRIHISPDGIEEHHLDELGNAMRTMLGDDFEFMCARARAVAMTVSVDFANATLDQALPRLDVPGYKVKELRKLAADGHVKQIRFKTKPHVHHQVVAGERSVHYVDSIQTGSAGSHCIAQDDTLLLSRHKKHDASMSFHQRYAIDLPLAELSGIQGGLHRIDFASSPSPESLGLPSQHAREFLDLIHAKGVNVAIAWSVAWDGGQAAARWWKSHQVKWWDPGKVWDQCVADLPPVGKFIAAGFRSAL